MARLCAKPGRKTYVEILRVAVAARSGWRAKCCEGGEDADSEWKKQQTKVLKVVRPVRDRKGRLSAERGREGLKLEGGGTKDSCKKGGQETRTCLPNALARPEAARPNRRVDHNIYGLGLHERLSGRGQRCSTVPPPCWDCRVQASLSDRLASAHCPLPLLSIVRLFFWGGSIARSCWPRVWCLRRASRPCHIRRLLHCTPRSQRLLPQ